jgi:hypothetical protein
MIFRYLGVIRANAKDDMVRGLTAVEMITRSAKSVIRQRMRKCESDIQLRQVLVDHFNLVLGKSEPSKIYWNLMIKVCGEPIARSSRACLFACLLACLARW